MTGRRSQEGVIIRDDRPAGGGKFEWACYQCKHCSAQVPIDPLRQRPAPYCSKCDRYICPRCATLRNCTPIEARIEKTLREANTVRF